MGFRKNICHTTCLLMLPALVISCGTNTAGTKQTAAQAQPSRSQIEKAKVAELQVVDCLLPGQVRRLGNTSYMTPRRPTRTTASDCRIRGGEYVEFDRADYKTALKVWMAAAESGDAEAQVNVGEIFERGLGGSPNYAAAVIWYKKASEQGNSRAQFNLGTLYERGLGVEKSQLKALNLYRKAWGLPEDDVIYQSAAYKESQQLRAELKKQIDEKNGQINLLQRQIQDLQNKMSSQADTNQEAAGQLKLELTQLRNWVNKLEQEKKSTETQFETLPVFREPKPVRVAAKKSDSGAGDAKDLQFGKYYALIIGNQEYSNLENLFSPRRDATEVANLLESKYGFAVKSLIDASNVEVMQAINDLNDELTEKDNLLVFYAGHGSRIQSGELEDGYWLPVNADAPPTDTFWVPNEFVTRHLARLKAKRVLVVADSCYSGLLSSAPGYLFVGEGQQYTDDYIRYKLPKKSRLLLASGGDKPVLDNAGGNNSVFAKAFLEELRKNDSILSGPELFIRIRDKVRVGSRTVGYEQEPEFKAIKGAGHEVGDFFFVPVANLKG